MTISIAGKAGWLGERHLQQLLALLAEDGEAARVAGIPVERRVFMRKEIAR